MALASDPRQCLQQNLQDAMCTQEQTQTCMELDAGGKHGQMLLILRAHRKELLQTIHSYQKALDSLDYLVFQTEKMRKRV